MLRRLTIFALQFALVWTIASITWRSLSLANNSNGVDYYLQHAFSTDFGVTELYLNLSHHPRHETGQQHNNSNNMSGNRNNIADSINSNNNNNNVVVVRKEERNWTHEWLVEGTHDLPPRIMFVHVGKTGGETMRALIPLEMKYKTRKLQCFVDEMSKRNFTQFIPASAMRRVVADNNSSGSGTSPIKKHSNYDPGLERVWQGCFTPPNGTEKSALGRHTLTFKHMLTATPWHRPMLHHVNTFMVALRNPISRVVSAFNFHRNRVVKDIDTSEVAFALYYSCFPTVNDMANALMDHPTTLEPDAMPGKLKQDALVRAIRRSSDNTTDAFRESCATLAKQLLRGRPVRMDAVEHIVLGYRYYHKLTIERRPEIPVLGVRTNNLWDDVTQLETALGGNKTNFRFKGRVTHRSNTFAVQSGVETAAGKRAMCCHLYQDLAAHQSFVLLVINFNHDQKTQLLQETLKDCGVVTNHDEHSDLVANPFSWEDWHSQNCHLPPSPTADDKAALR